MKQANLGIVELNRESIDIDLWDKCITKAFNGRIYARSWFLDAAFPNWRGIVVGKYNYVMPICPSKKLGISYLFQPTYCQQHGIFPVPTPEIFNIVFKFITDHYRFVDICLNSMNISYQKEFEAALRSNYLLSLNDDYLSIKKNYSQHCKRHLTKTVKQAIYISEIAPHTFMDFKKKHNKKSFKSAAQESLQRIINASIMRNASFICGAFSSSNELLAVAFFVIDSKRIIYLNGISSEQGHSENAMYAIINHIIKKNCETQTFLDFEGSTVEGIARFFSGFGAQPEHYPQIRINNLPFLLKYIKK